MASRKRDGRRRLLVQAYVDQNIPLSAAKSNMTNAEFIEALFKKFNEGSIPDSMPLEEKIAKRVKIDQELRALDMVIAQEKEDALKSASAAQAQEVAEAANILAVQRKAVEDGEWVQAQQWFNGLPKDEKDRIGWFRKSIIPAWKEHAKPVIVE